jgi:hypothetical protein
VSARNTRFVERVRYERAALACVNNTFLNAPALGALSSPAISTWYDNAVKSSERVRVESVCALLRELCIRLDIQANNSREVFQSVKVTPDTDSLLVRLKVACEPF